MRAARVDANHAEVRDGIREALPDATVHDSKSVGDGFPDLVVGWRGINFLIEVKPKGGELRGDKQCDFHAKWAGQVVIAHSTAEAIACMLRHVESTK